MRVAHGVVTALVWDAPKVKNRRPHTIPLTEGTRRHAIVQRLWEAGRLGRPLFHVNGKPLGALRSEWRRACENAGVPCGRRVGGFVLHDTRVSAISNLADAGVPDTVARSISGHRTPSVHARYQITAESTQADALNRAEAKVAKLSNPRDHAHHHAHQRGAGAVVDGRKRSSYKRLRSTRV